MATGVAVLVLEVKASWACRWWSPCVRLWTPVLRVPETNEAPGGMLVSSVLDFVLNSSQLDPCAQPSFLRVLPPLKALLTLDAFWGCTEVKLGNLSQAS